MTCIDLKDAYLSVHIHESSQKYLCFQWRNRSFAFPGLPFGLNTAPRIFTKLLRPVAAYLRKRGIRIIVYLHDFLILGSSVEDSRTNTLLILDLLHFLGFTINWEKSILVPSQSLTFLGLCINSLALSLSLPEKKILNIHNKCHQILSNYTQSAREVASLVGTLALNRSSQTLCQLETRPQCYRPNDHRLGSSKRLRLSTIQSDISSPEKGIPGQRGCGLNGISVADTTLVASSSGSPHGKPCNDSQPQAPPKRPCSPSTCTPDVPQAPPSCLAHIREITKQKAFRRTLPKYSSQPLAPPHINLPVILGNMVSLVL